MPPATFAAQVGQLVEVVVHRGRTAIDNQLIMFQLPQDLVDQHKRQANVVGNVTSHQIATRQQKLEDQRLDLAFG